VTVGEVQIGVGDYVVGDADGVVVIPKSVIHEVLARAEALVGAETRIRDAILAGEPPEDAYRRLS
jgi:4-hydroxy-4-methyl-2-oxoglutarate aldolase